MYSFVQFFTEQFHTTYLEVVSSSSYKLIELTHLIAVTYTPAAASEFLTTTASADFSQFSVRPPLSFSSYIRRIYFATTKVIGIRLYCLWTTCLLCLAL